MMTTEPLYLYRGCTHPPAPTVKSSLLKILRWVREGAKKVPTRGEVHP
jgi:hypothetical protein